MRYATALFCILTTIASPVVARNLHSLRKETTATQGFDSAHALKLHNDLRASLGAPPLSWSTALAQDAQNWANQLAQNGKFNHAAQKHDGENLWSGWGQGLSPDEYFLSWKNESPNFINGEFPNISKTSDWSKVGHYSQLIWHDTKELGCASAKAANRLVIVCRYRPAGNVEGEKALP